MKFKTSLLVFLFPLIACVHPAIYNLPQNDFSNCVNKVRQTNGVCCVYVDNDLTNFANIRANELAATGEIKHEGWLNNVPSIVTRKFSVAGGVPR